MKSRQYAARQKIRYLFERQGITCRNKRQAIAVLKGITLTTRFTKIREKRSRIFRDFQEKPNIRRPASARYSVFPLRRYFQGLSIIENVAFTFSARGAGRANRGLVPTNEVNFAERPLAGIHAKLTMLRDNAVIAMRGFACARRILQQTSKH